MLRCNGNCSCDDCPRRWEKIAARVMEWIPSAKRAAFVTWVSEPNHMFAYEQEPLKAVRLFYMENCR